MTNIFRPLSVLLLIFAINLGLAGCSGEPELSQQSLHSIQKEGQALLSQIPGNQTQFNYSEMKTISGLSPKKIYTNEQGLYLLLHLGINSETGLYIPREGIRVNTQSDGSPYYTALGEGVFQYKIKG